MHTLHWCTVLGVAHGCVLGNEVNRCCTHLVFDERKGRLSMGFDVEIWHNKWCNSMWVTVVFVFAVCAFDFFYPMTDLWFGQCNG